MHNGRRLPLAAKYLDFVMPAWNATETEYGYFYVSSSTAPAVAGFQYDPLARVDISYVEIFRTTDGKRVRGPYRSVPGWKVWTLEADYIFGIRSSKDGRLELVVWPTGLKQ
jgi:hypothetical protein